MLIPCPACQRQVSEQALSCPGCGHPLVAAGPGEMDPPLPAPADAAPEGMHTEELQAPAPLAAQDAAARVEAIAEEVPVAEPRKIESSLGLPGLSPDPDPTPMPPPVSADQDPHLPGSLPAASLLLLVFALGIIEHVAAGATGTTSNSRANCISLIIGIGLLQGWNGFRTWGVFSSLFGLLVWPLLLQSGQFGPASLGSYLGLIFNLGILLLLAGVPSRKRVGWGIAVAVLGILASGIGSAKSPQISTDFGSSEPVKATLPPLVPTHQPQPLTLPAGLGSLTATVPSGLPEVQPKLDLKALDKSQVERGEYTGQIGEYATGLVAFRLAPGYDFDYNRAADGLTSTNNEDGAMREERRAAVTLGGKPALRIDCTLGEGVGGTSFIRYEYVQNGRYVYLVYVIGPAQEFLDSDPAQAYFASVHFPNGA